MATKPVIFKPTLNTPQGVNNYSGAVFRCFTKGDTIPFRFTFTSGDAGVLDIEGWKVYIIMADILAAERGVCNGDQNLIEVEIPLADLSTGVFEGEITGLQSQRLPSGLVYALAKYVTAPGGSIENPIPGNTHIIDMCTLEVYPNL